MENSLWCAMLREGIICDLHALRAMLSSNFVPCFHSLKSYLDSLPECDRETDFIGQLADMVHCKCCDKKTFLDYYLKPLKGEQIKYLNTAQIMLRFGGAIRLNNNQLVRVLKELGFTQARTSSCRFWLMVERTQEEMAQMLPEPIEEIETAATDPSEAADTLQDKETIQDKETFPDKDLYVDGGGDRTLPSEPELW